MLTVVVVDVASPAITATEGSNIKVCLNLTSGSIDRGFIIPISSRLVGENGNGYQCKLLNV